MSLSVGHLSFRKGGFFVDLFVRVSNQVAVNMYKQLGYSVYRTVIEYYSASSGEPDEDAYGELPYRHTSTSPCCLSCCLSVCERTAWSELWPGVADCVHPDCSECCVVFV